jgi:small-conductance mechanosensitive channel
MSQRRLHPERIVMVLLAAFGLATYALLATAYFGGFSHLYRWAWITGTITVLTGCLPLLTFLIGLAIEKLRGDRHD